MTEYVTGAAPRSQISIISFDEMINETAPVRVFDCFCESLDYSGFKYNQTKETGRKPYSPCDIMKLYIYGYFYSLRTSRKLMAECHRNIEVIWLLNGLTPDFRTISDFRKDNIKLMKKVFKQFSLLCDSLGLYGKEIIAVDGTKIRASNARKKNMTRGRVEKMLKYYEEAAEKYLELLETSDDENTAECKYSADELAEKIAHAKTRIEELTELSEHIAQNGEVSLTDPDSRLMGVSNAGYDVCYNMQTAVDSKYRLIVETDVVNTPNDQGHLYEMANKAKTELGVEEITVLADKGYHTGEDLAKCEQNGIAAIVSKQNPSQRTDDPNYSLDRFKFDEENNQYTCPEGKILTCRSSADAKKKVYRSNACKTCPSRDKCTKNKRGRQIIHGEYQDVMVRATQRLQENMELYKTRQTLVEHPFGTLKRSMGYTYFLLRGIEKVKGEGVMHSLVYNFKRALNIIGTKGLMEAIRLFPSAFPACIFNFLLSNMVLAI